MDYRLVALGVLAGLALAFIRNGATMNMETYGQ